MNHQPDIRLVDAHSERVGGADDLNLIIEKFLLNPTLLLAFEPRVEEPRPHAMFCQVACELFRVLPGSLNASATQRPSGDHSQHFLSL